MDLEKFKNIDLLLNYMSSSSSSEDETDEEEFLDVLKMYSKLPAPSTRRLNYKRFDAFYEYNEIDFEMRFRLPKSMVVDLAKRLTPVLATLTNRGKNIPIIDRILITLRYYATGSFQLVNADLFGVSQPSISNIITQVSKAIASLGREEIQFPSTSAGLSANKLDFFAMYGIPDVIGVIDGTHIPIQSPGGQEAERYRCRKGFFSINTQLVCDANMRIMDIVARWPGSCHDQMIFNFSQLCCRLEEGSFGNAILLGDSGYACRKYLITPIPTPTNNMETSFNKSFIKTRLVVERTIGVLKRRFPVLSTRIRLALNNTVVVIVAIAVCHNLLKGRPVPDIDPEVEMLLASTTDDSTPQISETNLSQEISDYTRRDEIVRNFFSS